MDNFGRQPYITERDEYKRKDDIRQQLRLFGQPDAGTLPHSSTHQASQDSVFPKMGSLSSTPYGISLGSASDSSYHGMNSSAMQRYAPRLDELNRTRMSTSGPDTSGTGRNVYDLQGTQTSFHVDSLAFVPGPQRPFSHHSSTGWLNE
ncbi:hypothetical protein NE237_029884 [Protea cynaroides]|uniref:Uncharacterized protein n=1 Tax=Protea cynaroides TaxID=273540 RepID=A0A9Q0GW48_9MAGN|nr:hypothetical protein NE237_029884 [Protea cynaroides]